MGNMQKHNSTAILLFLVIGIVISPFFFVVYYLVTIFITTIIVNYVVKYFAHQRDLYYQIDPYERTEEDTVLYKLNSQKFNYGKYLIPATGVLPYVAYLFDPILSLMVYFVLIGLCSLYCFSSYKIYKKQLK